MSRHEGHGLMKPLPWGLWWALRCAVGGCGEGWRGWEMEIVRGGGGGMGGDFVEGRLRWMVVVVVEEE